MTTNGYFLLLLFRYRALFDEDNQITEYQAVGRDITDKRKAKDDLIKEKELDNCDFGVCVLCFYHWWLHYKTCFGRVSKSKGKSRS